MIRLRKIPIIYLYNEAERIFDGDFTYGWIDEKGRKRTDFESGEYMIGNEETLRRYKTGTCWEMCVMAQNACRGEILFMTDWKDVSHSLFLVKDGEYWYPFDPFSFGLPTAIEMKTKDKAQLIRALNKSNLDIRIVKEFPKAGASAEEIVDGIRNSCYGQV